KHMGGATSYTYVYDDLYRLTEAHGTAAARLGGTDHCDATFHYDDIHSMTQNAQVRSITRTLNEPGVAFPPKTNHDFGYAYEPAHPHQATKIGDTFLVYDG